MMPCYYVWEVVGGADTDRELAEVPVAERLARQDALVALALG